MPIRDMYPLITAPDLDAVKTFYETHFDASAVFQANWFLMLVLPDEDGGARTLAFMTPDHPSRPPGPEPFDGKGMILTLQVDDAAAAFARAEARNAPIHYALADEPWGQRRFMLRDPAGMLLDVVEQTEPAAGFWDRYNVRA